MAELPYYTMPTYPKICDMSHEQLQRADYLQQKYY